MCARDQEHAEVGRERAESCCGLLPVFCDFRILDVILQQPEASSIVSFFRNTPGARAIDGTLSASSAVPAGSTRFRKWPRCWDEMRNVEASGICVRNVRSSKQDTEGHPESPISYRFEK